MSIKNYFRAWSSPAVFLALLLPQRQHLEENIVRYASGYVPYSLMKKHERNVTEMSAFFVECLSSMAVNSPF